MNQKLYSVWSDGQLFPYPDHKTGAALSEAVLFARQVFDIYGKDVYLEEMNSKEREKWFDSVIDRIDLTLPPPEKEPQRQYYYMAALHRINLDYTIQTGMRKTMSVQTFGCQANARDSESYTGILSRCGYVPVETEDADLVLYNTCSVRENANLRVYGHLGQMKRTKKNHPDMLIGICGCMMQEPQVVDKIKSSYRHVDIIFGTHNNHKLAELIWTRLQTGKMVTDILEDNSQIVENLPTARKYPFKTGINIMFGCNNFCTYCIVPYVRGREKSREVEDILQEIRKAVSEGVKEVMLLGQNVNSYGKNLDSPVSFAQLLEKVEEIEGLERIRFMTSHPKDMSDELIQLMGKSEKICHHLHLPLQSGSDVILKKMNRHYTRADYMKLVEKVRAACPDISLTTDIIVGFPGETEEDFLQTMEVVEQVAYDSAFTFIYSKRTGTPAARMTDQVPEEVVHDRFDRLLALVQKKAAEGVGRFQGLTVPVLVESLNDHDSTMLTGRMSQNFLVHFKGSPDLIGTIVPVNLLESKGFYYIGELVE